MSISVLVVEDDGRKTGKIVHALGEAGVQREAIDVCQTGMDARDKLAEKQYDLLLLDISLPHRAEDRENPQVGIQILEDLMEREGLFNRPRHIVGITQFEKLHVEIAPMFAQHMWMLIHCDEFSDAWAQKIGKYAEYLLSVSNEVEGRRYRVDLCVVTALADPEFKAVLNLPWNWHEGGPLDSCTFPVEGRIVLGDKTLSVVAATANRAGMTASTVLVSKLLQVYRPRVLALTGICAGVRGKVNIGDVVLGSPAWDWQRGKVVAEGARSKVLIEPIQIPIPGYVDTEFHRMAQDNTVAARIRAEWVAGAPETSLAMKTGPIATGGLVIAAGGGMEGIRSQHRNLMAVDMETYGVYGAATYGPDPRPTFLSIKSVSDFGEEDKDDKWQAYAAYASAQALRVFIERSHEPLLRLAGRI